MENIIESKVFKNLYGVDKKNKIKEWSIKVEHERELDCSVITTCYGYVNGKKVESRVAVRSGKNKGKKNETTHFQQAILDAQSKWNKKKDIEEFQLTIPVNGGVPDKVFMLPMLAQEFVKNKQKVKFPCYLQSKLDGYRMIYDTNTKKCSSRQGKEFTSVSCSNLYKELQEIREDIVLDGELYVHGIAFEKLGVLRKKKLTEQDLAAIDTLEYHVYDIIDTKIPFEKRLEKLELFFKSNSFTKIVMVKSYKTLNEQCIYSQHKTFVEQGYEGTIIRNGCGIYKCKYRSYDLLKLKDFMDAEYTIVDFTCEKGDNTNLVVWICKNNNGDTFNVRPKGTSKERNYLYTNGESFVGKKLWTKYFELTDKGIPRFPTTFRESYIDYIRDNIE